MGDLGTKLIQLVKFGINWTNLRNPRKMDMDSRVRGQSTKNEKTLQKRTENTSKPRFAYRESEEINQRLDRDPTPQKPGDGERGMGERGRGHEEDDDAFALRWNMRSDPEGASKTP